LEERSEKKRVRNKFANTQLREEGVEGGTPGLEQRFPCTPEGDHGGAWISVRKKEQQRQTVMD